MLPKRRQREDPIAQLKRQIADEINLLTEGWTQSRAAVHMHVSQSRISELRRGKLENVSLEMLLRCLSYFSWDLEIRTNRTTFTASVYPRPRTLPSGRRGGWAPEREDPELDNRP